MSELEKHPDLLRRQLLIGEAEQQEWKEYLHLVSEFEKGIRFVLRRGVNTDIIHDLVSECFERYIATCGEWSAQSYGKDAAKRWLRANFKEEELPTSKGKTKHWVEKSPVFGKLARQNNEGQYIEYDAVDSGTEPKGWMGKEKQCEPYMPEHYTMFRATADYEICLRYAERKVVLGNRFTRAESAAYESALRRLRKAATTG
jgi:hypothetical protein